MLNHKGTQIIETARLILRRAVIDDAEIMFRNWANDAEVTKYLTWPPHENIDVTKALLTSRDIFQPRHILHKFIHCVIRIISCSLRRITQF